jgi:glutamate synthase (NADPH) small chain
MPYITKLPFPSAPYRCIGSLNTEDPIMAKERMLKFVGTGQSFPKKREAKLRAEDFQEIAARYAPDKAVEQSSRCSQCGVPYCSVHCPLGNHIPDWLRLTAEGRLREAYELSNLTSSMPEICGRICPQDRLCEGNCVIEFSGHGAVTIGSVEKYITDTAWAEGWVEPIAVGEARGASVGIIGAGPGGLTAAEYLRVAGYDVHVYDRYDRMGGLLTYGIPGFKLEKDVVMRRIARLEEGGVVFHANFEVGRDATLDALRSRHDSVLIATGVYKARDITAPGIGLGGIHAALDYLTASNRQNFGDVVPAFEDGTLNAHGKNVVVIGGGDTAMDCVRTAVRQGAKLVKCLYRRDRENMPGSQREVANAEEEGVEFVWLSGPKGFDGSDSVERVHVSKMRLGAPDASGRRAPEADPQGDFTLDADLVITALGFEPEALPSLFGAPDLNVTRWGTIRADHVTGMTNLDGVFAVGDIVRGASLVVWAIKDGRDVVEHMHRWMGANRKRAKIAA